MNERFYVDLRMLQLRGRNKAVFFKTPFSHTRNVMMQKFVGSIRKLFVREEGATMVEYGLMVALIAVVCIAAVTLLGSSIKTVFTNIAGSV